LEIYYLVYKLTNSVNGKIYIGCHMTKNLDDGYMGSGKRLGYAKKKYGIENFKKDILSNHETPEQMLIEEARLVNEEFLGREDVYNLTLGGKGGWKFHNQDVKYRHLRIKGAIVANQNESRRLASSVRMKNPEFIKKRLEIRRNKTGFITRGMLGKKHSEETKNKMRASHNGKKNSQCGKCWIFSDKDKISKSILLEELELFISLGWIKGRKIKFCI